MRDGANGDLMGSVRFSVGEFTTPRLSFAEDLEVYRRAGAAGIGIDAALKLRDPREDLARFRDSGLAATYCFPHTSTVLPGRFDPGPANPADRVAAMCASIRALAAFEPLGLVCGPGPYGTGDRTRAYDFTVPGLRQAARAAAAEGLPLLLEPMHPTLEAEWSFLVRLDQAVAMVHDIGEPNVGIMFDIWHQWDSPNVRELLAANIELVRAVQVDDWRDPTRGWCDRVLPGDGIADVAGILRQLRACGYEGWLELEIFSDDGLFGTAFPDSLWARDPEQIIRLGRERTLAAWAAGGARPGIDSPATRSETDD
jgi:sugar phosphate isomerase/epimerase